jgi:hypothetical protein
MFCAPGLIFGATEGVGSRFHVLRARTHFWWYRGRQFSFSCFARPDSLSAVPRASRLNFMFCALGDVFGDAEYVGSRFHVLHAQNDFGDPEGEWSRFHVLCAGTSYRRYRERRVSFSCLALPESFPAVMRVSGPFFMFSAPGVVSRGNEGVRSRFHVLHSRSHFQRFRGRWVPFSFCAPRIIFGCTEGVGSRFLVFRSQPHLRRYRGRRFPFSCVEHPDSLSTVPRRRVLFSCFALPDSFSAVPRASGTVFMFCTRTHFRRYRGRRLPF